MSNLEILEAYYNDLFLPSITWPKYEYLKRIYSKWALGEIIKLVKSNSKRPARDIVFEFWSKMDDYSEINNSIIFKIARDLASEILELFSEGE